MLGMGIRRRGATTTGIGEGQKDTVLTASKTILILKSWHRTLVPALGSKLNVDV